MHECLHVDTSSKGKIGAGSSGQVFRGRYAGFKVGRVGRTRTCTQKGKGGGGASARGSLPRAFLIHYSVVVAGAILASPCVCVCVCFVCDRETKNANRSAKNKVAVKELFSAQMDNNMEESFQEAETLARLRHPNIVTFYGIGYSSAHEHDSPDTEDPLQLLDDGDGGGDDDDDGA